MTAHPRVDLKMLTKDGKTAEEVAVEEGADASFLGFLRDCLRRQNVQELVSAARDGEWEKFSALLASSSVVTADLNTVPIGRKMGVIHQVERERACAPEREREENGRLSYCGQNRSHTGAT